MNRQNIILVASAAIATALAMLAVPAIGQLANQASAPAISGPAPDPVLQDRIVPDSAVGLQQSFAPIVKRSAPAVVNVYSSVNITRSNCPYANDPFWASFYCGGNTQTRNEKVDNSLGSGVIVGADGVIVTNNHVVERPQGLPENQEQEFRVMLSDRREFSATLVMADPKSDLAVLKIDTKGEQLPTLTLADTRNVQVGDLVLAIGNPFGVGQSVASGIVSALARTDVGASDFGSFIQTDASINPGNSGGALVDMQGRLVGVNTMIFSRGGGSNGVGFAIPAEMVKRVVDAAVRGGSLVRPWLGAKGDTINSAKAAALGLDRPRGVLISAVYAGGPADKAGLKEGDVVLTVDGREVFDDRGMKFIAATKAEGETVTLSVLRNGQTRQVSVRMAAPPGASKAEVVQVSGQNPFTGAVVAELSPALAEELGLDAFNGGMWVYSVPPRTIARNVGFQPGDIIREVNGTMIRTKADFEAAIKKAESTPPATWRLATERNGQRIESELRGR
ncbi:MAG: serine protease [Alphaproteobacteria bacterium 32-64-14]|nr:MAG: serine protease [Alphaproteobacteria bacterium 32-64-14]